MFRKVLVTGGSGFIGSHLTDALVSNGFEVRILDNLSPQVHGVAAKRPDYLNAAAEFIQGDVRSREILRRCLRGVDAVFHLAAAVGVGQSMYEVADYTDVNAGGTAILMEELSKSSVEKLIVASSMSIYGEGLYQASDGRICTCERKIDDLKNRVWECVNVEGQILAPLPTPESKFPSLPSIYALTKYVQEKTCLMLGAAYNIPTTALRFFNVYGTRQALSNPYTGVLAIFASRLLNDRPPLINEDGFQKRDFVSVRDVVQACLLALDKPEANGKAFNVGSGHAYTIREIASRVASAVGKPHIHAEITGKYRVGDIRHCFADISLISETLGYSPKVHLTEGLVELAGWLEGQTAIDRFTQATEELTVRGLSI